MSWCAAPSVPVQMGCRGLAEDHLRFGDCGERSRSAMKILFDPHYVALHLPHVLIHKHSYSLLLSPPSRSSSPLLFSFLHHLIPFLLPISFPPLLSLIKLPGALIKCNPPPPSPSSSGIRQSTNSISSPGSFEVDCQGNRQLLQFHHLHNPTTALIHAHQSGGWANMLDRAAHWH